MMKLETTFAVGVVKSSTEDLLVENAFNCHIGFIRFAEEVKELIRPDDDYSNKLTTEVLKRTLSIFPSLRKNRWERNRTN